MYRAWFSPLAPLSVLYPIRTSTTLIKLLPGGVVLWDDMEVPLPHYGVLGIKIFKLGVDTVFQAKDGKSRK